MLIRGGKRLGFIDRFWHAHCQKHGVHFPGMKLQSSSILWRAPLCVRTYSRTDERQRLVNAWIRVRSFILTVAIVLGWHSVIEHIA
jgi:hypothetical protein